MRLETILDRTETIRASVRDVEFTLLLTIGLVVLVVFLFLRHVRATLIPSTTVPLAVLGAFAWMYLMGYSLDNLSLMGLSIAIGFVVDDDAIVVIKNIYKTLDRMWNARCEIPEIADADVIDEVVPLSVDGCDAGAAVKHVGPFGSLVPMQFANAAGIQTHVHAGNVLGNTEFPHGDLTGPAAGLLPHDARIGLFHFGKDPMIATR
jgi:hypothetical protein